jgi:hypothetical protein
MKRYIYIIIGIVVVAVIAIVAIFIIKNNSAGTATGGTGTLPGSSGSLPSSGTQTGSSGGTGTGTTPGGTTGGTTPSSTASTGAPQATLKSFGVLSSDPILDYFVDAQNNITGIEPNGSVVSIANGQSTTIGSSTINGIISASFSADGKKILVSFGNPTDPQGTIFDLATQKWTVLPQGLQSPRWSTVSGNYQIAYLAPGDGTEALSIINAANLKSGVATVFTFHANDLTLQWLSQNQFTLSEKPTMSAGGSIWLYNSKTATIGSLIYETAGAEGLWSSDPKQPYGIVFSDGASGQNPNLQLESLTGNIVQQFNFVSLPSMCLLNTQGSSTSIAATSNLLAASSSYLALYCGVPRSSSAFLSAHLPDDYNSMAVFASDDIYEINTVTGRSEVLWADQTQNMDVSDMKLFNGMLFFVNRYDQKLYGLSFAS